MKDKNLFNESDYTFFDFDETANTRKCATPTDGFQIYTMKNAKSSNHTLTIGSDISKIIERKGLGMMRIRVDNITGQIHAVFNNEKGKKLGRSNGSRNYRICGIDVVKCILEHKNVEFNPCEEAQRYSGTCSGDLSHSDKYATFELLDIKSLD